MTIASDCTRLCKVSGDTVELLMNWSKDETRSLNMRVYYRKMAVITQAHHTKKINRDVFYYKLQEINKQHMGTGQEIITNHQKQLHSLDKVKMRLKHKWNKKNNN